MEAPDQVSGIMKFGYLFILPISINKMFIWLKSIPCLFAFVGVRNFCVWLQLVPWDYCLMTFL